MSPAKSNRGKPSSEPDGIVILGATGSVGGKALEVVREDPGRFRAAGIAANNISDSLISIIKEFNPEAVALGSKPDASRLNKMRRSPGFPSGLKVFGGAEGLEEIAALPGVKKVINALPGISGIGPSIAALDAGKALLTANKESIVAAGQLIVDAARRNRAALVPIDSEHSAIFQCISASGAKHVRRLLLTASGGPFLDRKRLDNITPEAALRHPRWKMGRKVTVDSASMMNKGLEIIEAMRLFGVPEDRIDILVHPEAVVHSMVEFTDGALLAQISAPDMRIPIRFALYWPERCDRPEIAPPDFFEIAALTFRKPDEKRFPCIAIARAAARMGGLFPAVLSSADEAAVDAFLSRKIRFTEIPVVIEKTLESAERNGFGGMELTLKNITRADAFARRAAALQIKKFELQGGA